MSGLPAVIISPSGFFVDTASGGSAGYSALLARSYCGYLDPVTVQRSGVVVTSRLVPLMRWQTVSRPEGKLSRALSVLAGNRSNLLGMGSYVSHRFRHRDAVGRLLQALAFHAESAAAAWERSNAFGSGACVVHLNGPLSAGPFLKRCDRRRHRIIQTCHAKGALVDDLAGGLPCLAGTSLANSIRQTEFNEFKALDLLVFPSEGARKLARAAYGPEFESLTTAVVRTGIDLPRLSRYAAQRAARERSKSNVFTVVNVAAHVVQKRVDVLLRAIAMLRAELPCRLVNIGEGPLLPRHRDLVIELGIQDSVRFLGRQPNHVVLEHLAQADVFAMPSENVVFDLITLEAMGIGMPVIVTADGGNLECVQDQVNGFLLPPGDPSGLRDRLRMLARGPARADEIGRRAQAVVRTKFSDEVMVREYANHYANLF